MVHQVRSRLVCVDDFLLAIRTHQPTVSDEVLKRFHDFSSAVDYLHPSVRCVDDAAVQEVPDNLLQ